MEDREQEFGNLEVGYRDLLGKLADAKASPGRVREDQQLQEERQAETERVRQDE